MRIGKLAEATGTTAKTLRFYEDRGLLPPPRRTAGDYRDYGEDALARLDFIKRGRTAGLSLAQIRQVIEIRDEGVVPCGHVKQLLESRLADLDQQIRQLRAVREVVAHLRDDVHRADPADCHADAVCSYL